jgi:hypothetical protein
MVMLPCRSAMPLGLSKNLSLGAYVPTHDAVLSAVTMAVATDAMICTINFKVSFLLITINVSCLIFNVSLDIPQGGACYRRDARMFNSKAGA